ncbi:DUF4652 domain-containing protein [Clostridium rectalis]|uniref:DUF4652 domain-containing protein n=1 Tax=Clostridium rectalis TaxID=2040295 RepID=UPI000F62E81C|nr:DUF4652 domain-containing protein [Clostridium rectalis]
MKCSTFKKKLNDFIENNISSDIKNAMNKHLSKCSNCKKDYDEEIKINELLKGAFNVDNIQFNSSRMDIIKNIDKKRYSKNPINKLYYNLKKYKVQYISSMVIIMLIIFCAPFTNGRVYLGNINEENKLETSQDNIKKNEASDIQKNESDNKAHKNQIDKKNETDENFNDKVNEPVNDKKYNKEVNNIDKNSIKKDSKERSIANQLKGKENFENKVENNAESAKLFQWIDNKNILLVIENNEGNINIGDSVYLLNLDTGKNILIYNTKDKKKKIMKLEKVKKGNNNINFKLYINIYEDNSFTKSHVKIKTISNINGILNRDRKK